MVTDLNSLPAFEGQNYQPNSEAAPISAIQVRVSGVVGIDPLSRERVRVTAQRIETETGLEVDITAGSSPSPRTIVLPAGHFGRPALDLSEPWVKIGVALTILSAIDQKSLVLFVLILVVCGLFVTNAASAAVRGRRTELGVLAALGWTTPRLFVVVLGEVAAIGLVAGLAGAAIALPLAHLLGVSASFARASVAVPAALLLSLLAGLAPAIRAASVQPIAAVRPAVLEAGRAWRPRRVGHLALVNLLRVPGRSVLGALSLAIGVCALTLLLAATVAFSNLLVGSLLGGVVSVEVRGSDFVAVVTIVALGTAAVGDVLFLNLRERAGEMATLRAIGWDDLTIIRLVVLEGLWLGLLGSVIGGGLGLAGAAILVGGLPAGLAVTTILAMAAGTVLTGLVAIVPALWVSRLPTVDLLAQE
jgi:ABC-type antimicrobial peptide transport system permease subunit